jgi:uncharacterized protein YecE (DUF72 family)
MQRTGAGGTAGARPHRTRQGGARVRPSHADAATSPASASRKRAGQSSAPQPAAGEPLTGSGRIYIGTSGWSYRAWRESFYAGLPSASWLAHASRVFNSLEINGSFYRQVSAETFARWREETPVHFRFALKAHRYITHYKRLAGVETSIVRLRDPARELREKLAVVLWQLPVDLTADLDRLDAFLKALRAWPETRHSIEFRHPSWFTEEVENRLRDAAISVCLSDAPDFPLWRAVTSDLVYVRLHGHTRKYASSYHPSHLRRWARCVETWQAQGRDVHVYFDNDAEGAAVRNAVTLRDEVRSR